MCEERYSMLWWQQPPYVYADNVSTALHGIVLTLFQRSFNHCCNSAIISEIRNTTNQETMMLNIPDKNYVALPVSVSASAAKQAPDFFIRVMDTSGLAMITHPIVVTHNMLITGISSVWPLFATVLVLTGYAACGFWLASFTSKHRGTETTAKTAFQISLFDAYWFAFVSATTVGYGDKVPNSKVGKLFAMAWILCGICAVSTFTAAITTLLGDQQNTMMQSVEIRGNEIGVIAGTLDRHLVLESGGYPVSAGAFEVLRDLLHNRNICAIVADPHFLNKNRYLFGDDFRILPKVTNSVSVGYMFLSENASLVQCMRKQAFTRQLEVDSLLMGECSKINHLGKEDVDVTRIMMFREVDQVTLIWLVGILLGLCSALAAYEVKRMKPNPYCNGKAGRSNDDVPQENNNHNSSPLVESEMESLRHGPNNTC